MNNPKIHWRQKWRATELGPYEEWQQSEGIPRITGFFIDDLTKVPVEPWKRMGGLGTFINLDGGGGAADSYVCEIPPGTSLKPQRHLFEETILILQGRGATTIWREGSPTQTFEWQEGSLFSPPINTWFQLFNGQGDQPVRYWSVTTAPMVFSFFRNRDFIFNTPFDFTDRYSGELDFFSAKGESYSSRVWETNFVPDVYNFKLQPWGERGAGGSNINFEVANNTMRPHISQFPVGTYKKAHRHGPGTHVLILNGIGYSLLWREGKPMTRVNWHKNSVFIPPGQWFHQHFNSGGEPARYYAVGWGGRRFSVIDDGIADVSVKEDGGTQIEYTDESPEIMGIFEAELAKSGLKPKTLDAWWK
ncbi:ethanolamine ammonia lyase-activating protein [Chloroflexota bacterium]